MILSRNCMVNYRLITMETIFENFFSFGGRVRRRDYCLTFLVYILLEMLLSMATYNTYM